MKYLTDLVHHKNIKETEFQETKCTYVYNKTRTGAIYYKNTEIETEGTFGLSIEGDNLVCSSYNSIIVIDLLTDRHTKYKNTCINYKHAVYGNIIYTVGLGEYTETNIDTGCASTYKYYCNESECIHDILSIDVDEKYMYVGCDIGYLSWLEKKTKEVVYSVKFSGGITWIKKEKQAIEVGTYAGEYAVISESQKKIIDKNTGSIIWRIHTIEIVKKKYKIIAQSYDGIGVYTDSMEMIKRIPTSDLIYTVAIDEESKRVKGYNYYTGEIVEFSMYDVLTEAGLN